MPLSVITRQEGMTNCTFLSPKQNFKKIHSFKGVPAWNTLHSSLGNISNHGTLLLLDSLISVYCLCFCSCLVFVVVVVVVVVVVAVVLYI